MEAMKRYIARSLVISLSRLSVRALTNSLLGNFTRVAIYKINPSVQNMKIIKKCPYVVSH